ncbi:hypothetical protein F4677DRAFT_381180 [Hypoxylon crocopeplum]|nr:hypothetical protein F4677DRAFT_381180 [Hypoxylon crocopeplum]
MVMTTKMFVSPCATVDLSDCQTYSTATAALQVSNEMSRVSAQVYLLGPCILHLCMYVSLQSVRAWRLDADGLGWAQDQVKTIRQPFSFALLSLPALLRKMYCTVHAFIYPNDSWGQVGPSWGDPRDSRGIFAPIIIILIIAGPAISY